MKIEQYLIELAERKASDLHLMPDTSAVFRIGGQLVPSRSAAQSEQSDWSPAILELMQETFTQQQRLDFGEKRDVNVSFTLPDTNGTGRSHRFRAAIFWDRRGLNGQFRLIPTEIPSLSQLFAEYGQIAMRRLVDMKRGLILVVGPTGSGKCTTACSLVDAINEERGERIVTIEDPIEYVFTNKKSYISQREVGRDVESFEQGGLSALRSDPDVMLISELRTPESARIAFALAENGHLVFATMQADSVSESLTRLLEAFPDNRATMQRMIARSLGAVVAQRLIPRANGQGRVPVHEILFNNVRIRTMIENGQLDFTAAIEAGRSEGMCTADDSLLKLYEDGEIGYEQTWNYIGDRDRLGIAPQN